MSSLFSGLFGGGKIPKAQSMPSATLVKSQATPTKDAAAESADNELKKRQRLAATQGSRSTILTQEDSLEGTKTKRSTVLGA